MFVQVSCPAKASNWLASSTTRLSHDASFGLVTRIFNLDGQFRYARRGGTAFSHETPHLLWDVWSTVWKLLTRLNRKVPVGLATITLLIFSMASSVLAQPVLRRTSKFSFVDFHDLHSFALNGVTADIARDPARGSALRLTNNLGQGGSAFLKSTASITKDASFSTHFRFRISNPMGISEDDGQGADGIVFVVQTLSSKVGATGGGIGYEGLAPSVGIEFDTWANGVDADGNHVGIDVNGKMTSVVAKHVKTRFNNGKVWNAWVDYNGKIHRLEVRWSQSSDRPEAAMLGYDVDLAKVLGQTDVFLGFSSGTGSAGNTHDILDWRFVGRYAPIGAPQQGTLSLSVDPRSPVLSAPPQVMLILDASGSMRGHLSDGTTKIVAAKQAVRALISQLPTDVQVGMRVYGRNRPSRPKSASCQDSEIVVPFGPLNRPALLAAVKAVSPKGQTPIGLSLSKLPEDFGDAKGAKLAVLVTDGIETCAPDPGMALYPPTVVRSLRKDGFDVRVNVVGFDIVSSATRAFLEGLAAQSGGTYLDARDATLLSRSIRHAVSAGSPFTIVDTSGAPVARGTMDGTPVTLPPGLYGIRVTVGGEHLRTDNIAVKSAQTTELVVTGRQNKKLVVRQQGGRLQ